MEGFVFRQSIMQLGNGADHRPAEFRSRIDSDAMHHLPAQGHYRGAARLPQRGVERYGTPPGLRNLLAQPSIASLPP